MALKRRDPQASPTVTRADLVDLRNEDLAREYRRLLGTWFTRRFLKARHT